MIVRDPNGKIYNGNNVPGEFTSTNEKVFIKDAPVGTYFIDLINPTNVTDNLTVIIGMAVSGGFDTTDNEVNPSNGVILENNECINSCGNGKCSDGLCECDENHIGVYCQREINKINLNQNNTITLTPRYAYYFKFDNEDTDNDPSMRITSSLPASVRVCLDNQPHNAMYDWTICNTLDSSGEKNISIPKSSGKTIYGVMYPIYDEPFSITYIAGNNIGETSKSSLDKGVKIALIAVGATLAVILITILVVYLIIRFRKGSSRVKPKESSSSSSSNTH